MRERVLLSWSGGKDSTLSLHALQKSGHYEVAALLTTVTRPYDRVSMHGVRRTLLERQAASLGLPLHTLLIEPGCKNLDYERRLAQALLVHQARGIRTVAFGDIFLEDLRAYREQNLVRGGMQGLFPIWKRDTHDLARTFSGLGFRAIVTCVDPKCLDPSFAGRDFGPAFLSDLPANVDPCGENGEFHSFVFDGPNFRCPVALRRGEVVTRDGFVFCDLLPA